MKPCEFLKQVWLSKTFSNAYPDYEFKVISPENFHKFFDDF